MVSILVLVDLARESYAIHELKIDCIIVSILVLVDLARESAVVSNFTEADYHRFQSLFSWILLAN